MRQLRLVGLGEDGASLLLESPTGESYRLALDERVRAACRGDLTRLGQIEIETDNPLRPREIQSRVRAGESAEQVAASSGMPLDRVLRFAYPVLQERSRVIAQARTAAARPRADVQLGDLVEDRLVSRGTDAATLQWDAWRRDDGRWAVRLSWRHGERAHAAHWSLDLGRRALQAEDPAAEQLSAEEFHARTITAVTPLAVAARATTETPAPPRGTRAAAGPDERSRPGHPGPSRPLAGDRRPTGTAPEERPRPGLSRTPAGDARRTGVDAPSDDRPRPGSTDSARTPADHTASDRTPPDRPGPGPGGSASTAAAGSAPDARSGSAGSASAPDRTGSGGRADRVRGERSAGGTRTGGRGAVDRRESGERRPREAAPGADPEEDGEPAEEGRIAAGGGTIPLLDSDGEDDRARRATVPSWDDILLGVRRRH
jgi:hypothetical protein